MAALTQSAAAAPAIQLPRHERILLPNGIVLLILPIGDMPVISFTAMIKSGAAGGKKDGVAAMTADALLRGAGTRNASSFVDTVENVGGSFGIKADEEGLCLSGRYLARDQNLMIELLADVLQRPHLEPADFDRLRRERIDKIKLTKHTAPEQIIGVYGRALLFGDHPYGRPHGGSEASLGAIGYRDAFDFHASEIGADRLIVIVAGDLDVEALKQSVKQRFYDWRSAGSAETEIPEPTRMRGRRVLLVDMPDFPQTYVWIGNIGVNIYYPQLATLDLVSSLYSGRFTSILNTQLRVESGLCYDPVAGFTCRRIPQEFAIEFSTDTRNTRKTLDRSLQTLTRLKRDGITASQLESARAYEIGQYPLAFQTLEHWLETFLELELYGLDTTAIGNYLQKLRDTTLEDARHVIDTAFPSPDDLAIVLMGDARKIRRVARDYGPVTEMSIEQPAFS